MKKLIALLLLLTPLTVFAGAGLGLSAPRFDLGMIRKGDCYDVGKLTVLNWRGDETGFYQMSVTYLDKQPEYRVPRDWVIYTPQSFYIEVGGYQQVDVDLCVPKNAKKGDYFAYIEAGLSSDGNIGVAVATKLRFSLTARKY